MNDIEDQLRVAWNNTKRPDRTIHAVVLAALVGVVIGWGLHSFRWRAADFDYVFSRVVYTAAHCKGIGRGELMRRIEARVGTHKYLFNLGDKMAAMDYAMDGIATSRCGCKKTHN